MVATLRLALNRDWTTGRRQQTDVSRPLVQYCIASTIARRMVCGVRSSTPSSTFSRIQIYKLLAPFLPRESRKLQRTNKTKSKRKHEIPPTIHNILTSSPTTRSEDQIGLDHELYLPREVARLLFLLISIHHTKPGHTRLCATTGQTRRYRGL